ncbi:MAG: 23S rRNA (guanosine(2251)-2'-O)-methyltransferase RlmB [Deltaproteobacteria bacterium]|jgi:23S rRNA (guanosine2251-2'-O)-methyltransferase|nr:23S rRNA (guanosine(2251)-2'-O)-methyltransferase RlmB [Deltaproteobacteria bacterium]
MSALKKNRPGPKRPNWPNGQKPSPAEDKNFTPKKSPRTAPRLGQNPKGDGFSQDLILGFNPVRAALMARPRDCQKLYLLESRRLSRDLLKILELAKGHGLEVLTANRERLDGFGDRHQGLVLLAKTKIEPTFNEFLKALPLEGPGLIVFLDHLEDPHNFGALIRSSAAFGALGVIYPKDRSAPLSPAARMASAGASEVLPLIKVVNPTRAVLELKRRGFWVVAAEAKLGQDLRTFDFPERSLLIVGSEGQGLSRSLLAQADHLVHIHLPCPLIDSLNVSNAGAILLQAYQTSQAKK